ncbi:hypothetical protein BH23GEM3_BH23GEM3_10060 [soil metagenome]
MSAPRIFTPEYYARMRALEGRGWWKAGMREVAAMLIDLAELPPEGILLDVGCGSGQTMSWFLAARRGWTPIGVDLAPEGLDAARNAGLRRLLRTSALNLPLADQSVDLVITLNMLQHLPLGGGDRIALAEMHRVLRPGGYLFVRTNALAFPRTPDDADVNFRRCEPDTLRREMVEAGYRVVRLSRINAVLGLAEIPRELRAHHRDGARYHGILARSGNAAAAAERVKRAWLRCDARAVQRGWSLPLGRSIVALARA